MLKLPESARQRSRSFKGTAVSTILHSALIGGAVLGTGAIDQTVVVEGERVVPLIFQPRPPESIATPPEHPPIPSIATNVPPLIPAATQLTYQVADHLPPIDTRIGTMSEELFALTLRVASVATLSPPESAAPLIASEVDKEIEPFKSNPSPRYPAMLMRAGVEGVVHVRFVVDTLGRVERESIVFSRSDNVLFEREVRDVLARSRFSAAEAAGRKVRQLAEQPFVFSIRR